MTRLHVKILTTACNGVLTPQSKVTLPVLKIFNPSPPVLKLFTMILLYFFMWDDLPFIKTTQKTFKPSKKKCFNSQDGWEKTSYPGISTERYRRKHGIQVPSKKVSWKNNRVFQTPATYCHWKRYFSELNRCIFQISRKYIKLVIPKIHIILVLCSSNYSRGNTQAKIVWGRSKN